MMKNKKRKVTSTSTSTSTTPTTIASLPDDVVADILLRLPSAAAICRAVLASAHWIRVAASPAFLRLLRGAHSYPLLLGHMVSPDGQGSTPPSFHPAPLPHSPDSDSDGALAAMLRRGDFFLTRVLTQGSGRHVLEDCSGGLLLLSDDAGRALRVFDPMTHRVSSVAPLPSRGGRAQDHRGRRVCLLPNRDGDGDDPAAFRVMSLQHGNGKKKPRLEVYSSCTRAWTTAAGAANIPAKCQMAKIHRGQHSPAMHAGDRIFWKYDDAHSWKLFDDANPLLSLDTKTMTFSDVRLPPGVTRRSAYAVGETEDGACCLVEVGRSCPRQMQVWRFGSGAQMWELERQVPLVLASPSACLSLYQVRAIVGGIVLLCFNNSSSYQPHIAFRLESFKVEAEFTCRGLARPFVVD